MQQLYYKRHDSEIIPVNNITGIEQIPIQNVFPEPDMQNDVVLNNKVTKKRGEHIKRLSALTTDELKNLIQDDDLFTLKDMNLYSTYVLFPFYGHKMIRKWSLAKTKNTTGEPVPFVKGSHYTHISLHQSKMDTRYYELQAVFPNERLLFRKENQRYTCLPYTIKDDRLDCGHSFLIILDHNTKQMCLFDSTQGEEDYDVPVYFYGSMCILIKEFYFKISILLEHILIELLHDQKGYEDWTLYTIPNKRHINTIRACQSWTIYVYFLLKNNNGDLEDVLQNAIYSYSDKELNRIIKQFAKRIAPNNDFLL